MTSSNKSLQPLRKRIQSLSDADPLFENTSISNFRVIMASPAVDAGVNTGVTTDFDGVARPQDAAFDIGAFEFSGSGGAQGPEPPTNVRAVVR